VIMKYLRIKKKLIINYLCLNDAGIFLTISQ